MRLMLRYLAPLLLLLASCAPARAQVVVEKFAGPAEAAALALDDVLSNLHPDVTTLRYLWAIDRSVGYELGQSLALNACISRSAILYRPWPLYGRLLYRIDLASFATDKQDLDNLILQWDALADIDPYFHANKFEIIPSVPLVTPHIHVTPQPPPKPPSGFKRVLRGRYYLHPNGQHEFLGNFWKTVPDTRPDPIKYFQPKGDLNRDFREFARSQIEKALHSQERGVVRKTLPNTPPTLTRKVKRILAPYAGQALVDLAILTKSEAPILRADWLVQVVSSSADDGRYYEFRGIVDSLGDVTAEEAFEANLGVDRADIQKVATLQSQVTGKPRSIEFTYGTALRPTVGPGFYSITRDLFDGSIDDDQHPLKNLIRIRFDGSEAIGFLRNGLQEFALFDGAEALAREAPPQLVVDRTVPTLAPTRLQTPISCVRCHARENGWLSCPNELRKLLKGPFLRVLGEEKKFLSRADAEQLLVLYAGDITYPLVLARQTLGQQVFAITGKTVREGYSLWAAIFDKYWYELVDARVALIELGYIPGADPVIQFGAVIPPIDDETPTIAALRSGLAVVRRDFESDYAELASRALLTDSAALLQKLKALK
jgi:hypothetical protein